jgi:hypothetical protein
MDIEYITDVHSVVEEVEQLSLYWDGNGAEMQICVKQGNPRNGAIVAMKSAQTTRVNYIHTAGLTVSETWEALLNVARGISRTLIRNDKYVCIPHLNKEQMQHVFNHIQREIERVSGKRVDVVIAWEIEWDADDATQPPSSSSF